MEQTRKPKRVALFAGVDDYPKDSGIWPLRGAVNDATALFEFVRKTNSFDKDGIVLLRNPDAREIREAARRLCGPLGAGDFFFFFFAGHGVTENGTHHLLCRDSTYDHSEKCVYGAATFRDILGKTGKAFGWTLVLDACRTNIDASEDANRAVGDDPAWEARDISLCMDSFMADSGQDAFHSVIYSCDDGKTAGELQEGPDSGTSRGLFTYSLIETLEDCWTRHDPALFDQALIGRVEERMLENAKRKNLKGEQHPYYKANRNSGRSIPYFIEASTDFDKYKKWLETRLRDNHLVDDRFCRRCQDCLDGDHGKALQRAVLEVCRSFSSAESLREDSSEKTAAELLSAICSTINEVDGLQRKIDELGEALVSAPASEPGRENGARLSRPLSVGEARELSLVADGVTPDWWGKDRIRSGLDALRFAKTEGDALDALRSLGDAVRDEFVRKNYSSLGDKRLERLPAFFTSKTWNALLGKASSADVSPTSGALLSLFRLSTSCCRVLKY